MGKRTNTATWSEKYKRWTVSAQKDGVRRWFYSSTPGRTGQREANAKADRWLDDNIAGSNTKISALFANYLETVKATTSKSNYLKIESIGRIWILPNVGHLKIDKLNLMHLQRIIEKASAKGLAKKSLSNIRATIAAFVKYCRTAKMTTLLTEDLSIPRSARNKGKKILQPEELRILFSVDTTLYRRERVFDELIYAYRFQVLQGLRPGELLALRWDDVHGNYADMKKSKNWLDEFTDGKNENANRRYAISSYGQKILQKQAALTRFKSPFVFGGISQEQYRHQFQRYCKANGITVITPYELRHTFVSIAKCLPEGDVKSIIGHSQDMDTFGIYGHEITGDLERISASLSSVFDTILQPKENAV